jgi:hypothetical protein
MKRFLQIVAFTTALMPVAGVAQNRGLQGAPPLKSTYMRLGGNANAVLVEPVTPVPAKSRIAILITHPERINNLDYFMGWELPKYGYRALMINYYGAEENYYELLQPIAAGIKALRAIPGVEKVVLSGHSSGVPELTAYEDVAENGPKACQGAERLIKCDPKGIENLPKADGMLMFDSNSGAVARVLSLNPALDPHHPRQKNAALDMYDAKNGYDAKTRSAKYSDEFLKKYFAGQQARANSLIDEALDRLNKIEHSQGDFVDDEPFNVAGAASSGHSANGAVPARADKRLTSKTHAPHLLLKADGTNVTQVIPEVTPAAARPEDQERMVQTGLNVTVRHYLTYNALRVTPDYKMTEDTITGLVLRSSPSSMQGNVEGVHVPTLFLVSTCGGEVVLQEIGFDHSAAKDKELVGVEGATHGYTPCKPEYGDTFKRAFDYADSWLSKPGRF